MVVLTAKDLTSEDRQRLNGDVEKIMQKGGWHPDALAQEMRLLVAAHRASGESAEGNRDAANTAG